MNKQVLYRIANWDDLYEVAQSRKVKGPLPWISLRTKHDGDGYTALLDHPDGPLHYAAWIALLQVAAKCSPRGSLLRDNSQPATTAVLARQTRIPAEVFEAAIPRLIDIGWLVAEPLASPQVTSPLVARSQPATSTLPPDSHHGGNTGHNKTVQDKTEEATPKTPTLDDRAFEDFWRVVPRKVEPAKARTAFIKARQRLSKTQAMAPAAARAHLIERMTAFSATPKAKGEFCPYPATWLNGGRYDDDPAEWEKKNQFGKGGQGGHNRQGGRGSVARIR